MIEILPYGESAMLVNFEQKIDQSVNARVITLYDRLKTDSAIHYLIPAYCSLTIGFDQNQINYQTLSARIRNDFNQSLEALSTASRHVTIPVCYEPGYALDMDEVSEQTGLSSGAIIEAHTREKYQVYMLGFVAGFAYLGVLPEALQCSRKASPRKEVISGSVGLAGLQTGIYPTNAPGGWQIIGQTPIKTFNPNSQEPNLLKPGDTVCFSAINNHEFQLLKGENERGTFNLETLYG